MVTSKNCHVHVLLFIHVSPLDFTDSAETSDSQNYILLIIILPVACGTVLLFVLISFVIIPCVIRRMRVAKKSLEDHINQQPMYEEITQCYKDSSIEMELNASYGHIVTHSTQNHLTVSHF